MPAPDLPTGTVTVLFTGLEGRTAVAGATPDRRCEVEGAAWARIHPWPLASDCARIA